MSKSLRPHGLQDARLPCPALTPGAGSHSYLFFIFTYFHFSIWELKSIIITKVNLCKHEEINTFKENHLEYSKLILYSSKIWRTFLCRLLLFLKELISLHLFCASPKLESSIKAKGKPWQSMKDISSVQSLSHIQPLATPWTAACQASLSITSSWACSNSCPLSQ